MGADERHCRFEQFAREVAAIHCTPHLLALQAGHAPHAGLAAAAPFDEALERLKVLVEGSRSIRAA